MGSLKDVLSQSMTSEIEKQIHEIIARKVTGAVALYVGAVRAVEAAYGPEVVQIIRAAQQRKLDTITEHGNQVQDRSLRTFCGGLEAACIGSHEWVKLEDTETRQAYRFTRCVWADVFRALDAADIGYWICEGDGPAAAAFNPHIRFQRTKTLMEGHECCNHVYYVEDRA